MKDNEHSSHKKELVDLGSDSEDHLIYDERFFLQTRSCPFCRAAISESAIFCVHCRRHLKVPETDDQLGYTDITWGTDGVVFHHDGGRHVSYSELETQPTSRQPIVYQCPRCRSDHIQSYPVAHSAGTSFGHYSGSGYSVEAGNVNISGTAYHQTQLAGITSPPARPRPFLLAIIATFLVPFFTAMPLLKAFYTSPFQFILVLLFDAGLIIAAYILCGILAPKRWKKYRKSIDEWERSWICLRCSCSFYQ